MVSRIYILCFILLLPAPKLLLSFLSFPFSSSSSSSFLVVEKRLIGWCVFIVFVKDIISICCIFWICRSFIPARVGYTKDRAKINAHNFACFFF